MPFVQVFVFGFANNFTFVLAFLDGVNVDGRPNATLGPCDGTFKFA
jgi:hypothetical protein